MKRISTLLITLLCFSASYSQNRSNIWYFGEYAGIDFNTSPPTGISNTVMTTQEGCATVTDTNGQLLFFTDGIKVWNRNQQQMANGFGLLGGFSSTQSAVIVPMPGSANLYYIFTAPVNGGVSTNAYSIVDMNLNGGLGDITATKNVVFFSNGSEKITSVFQSNGVDYWIIVKEKVTDQFLAYSLTAAGFNTTPVSSHAGAIPVTVNDVGYMRISPNRARLAINYSFNHLTQVFDFNNATGVISNPIDIPSADLNATGTYGVEFSPDNTKLYTLQEGNCILMQYNLAAGSQAAIQASGVQLMNQPGTYGGAVALGPDNKVYVSRYMNSNVAYIDQPNLPGLACNFVTNGIQLPAGKFCRLGLPNNIYSPFIVNNCPPASNLSSSAITCNGQPYQLPWGTTVNAAGNYADTIRNAANTCDSIINTVNLSVFPFSVLTTNVHICPGQTYTLPSGTITSTAGIYADTIRSVAGCDSVIKAIHLFVDQVSLLNSEVHICPGQSYTLPSGLIVNTAGVYSDTLRSQASCDSIINSIELIIDQAVSQSSTVHICEGQSYTLPSGLIVNTEAVYFDTLHSQSSCDSVHFTIQLMIDHVTFSVVEAQICSNQHYTLPSGAIVNTAGYYQDTVRSAHSCDSVVSSLHLVVGNVSSSNAVDSIFDGQPYQLPSGQTVSTPGTYESVLVNSVGCDSVITTTLLKRKDIFECITLKNAITPNGDGINDYWVLFRYFCFKRMEVNVYNRYGSMVYHADDYQNEWNGKYMGKELPDGTYYYVIKVFTFDGKIHTFRNNVTLFR